MTPCEFIAKIAALVPPPSTHRHPYFGVLAPIPVMPLVAPPVEEDQETHASTNRSPARTLWAKLTARIYEVFPLLCLHCGGQMRLIAVINDGA